MLPLVLSSGAGAAGRIAVGTGVMGGMVVATAFGLFYTPLFYLVIRRWFSKKKIQAEDDSDTEPREDTQAEPR